MKYAFGNRSLENIKGLHPDLQKLAHAVMAETPIDFGVIMGVRTQAQQDALYAQGRKSAEEVNRLRQLAGWGPIPSAEAGVTVTWTRKSNHLPQADGYGHAMDIGVYVRGVYQNGDTPDEQKLYNDLAALFKKKIKELGLRVQWGPDAGIAGDIGHYQIS